MTPEPSPKPSPRGAVSSVMRALAVFFAITFAMSWTCWFATGGISSAGDSALVLLGTFAPGIVALILTARAEGRPGVTALLSRLFAWRVRARWYVFAFGSIAAIKLTAAVIHRLLLGMWPRFGTEPLLLMIAATLTSTLVGGQAGEEIGWRGFALPRLASRFGYGIASLLLGVIWAVWHLPLFFIAGTTTTGQSFPLYALQVTALSVALAWLYRNTNGSLLLTMLMHAAVNNTKDIVPSAVAGATHPFALSTSPIAWITVVLLWMCAGSFLLTFHSSASHTRNDTLLGTS